jgi:hypothetical protein
LFRKLFEHLKVDALSLTTPVRLATMGEVNCRLKLTPVGFCVFGHAYGVANADVGFAEKISDAHYGEEMIATVNRREFK